MIDKIPATKELSGKIWISRFKGSKEISDLEPTFRFNIENFINALDAARITKDIISTYRPLERSYLMHWCCEIKNGKDAKTIPNMSEVNIEWWHGDQTSSVDAAQEMFDGFEIDPKNVNCPAEHSKHNTREAIDMKLTWNGDITIKNASGQDVKITTVPRDNTNLDLIKIAKTYSVYHYVPITDDKKHWSSDGK